MLKYSSKSVFILVLFTLMMASQFVLAQRPQAKGQVVSKKSPTQLTHELTIYVDDGQDSAFGHVFVSLSERGGKSTVYRGFYPEDMEKKGAGVRQLTATAGGQSLDDSDHRWDVKRLYRIKRSDYDRAIAEIKKWEQKDPNWCLLNRHCGDFAEHVAKAAGVGLDLPWSFTRDNRPELFGKYLRRHGGIVNNHAQETVQGELAGTWTLIPTGETIVIRRVEGGAFSFRINGLSWTVTGKDRVYESNKLLTLEEVSAINPDTPPRAAAQAAAAGAKARISLQLTEANKTPL